MKNQVQLITYVDRLSSGGLGELRTLIKDGALTGLFGGVHLLPFFDPIDGSDAGFDPVDHTRIDPRLGDWADLEAMGNDIEIVADLIVNHVSSKAPQFQDFREKGPESRYAGMFLTLDRVFPNGATGEDLMRIYRPRPGLPFTKVPLAHGRRELLWTTFTPEQIDIDVQHPEGAAYLEAILQRFAAASVRMIRLDAAGYAIKRAGTSCFMIPETYEFIAALAARARALGIDVLVEIHSYYQEQVEIAKRVDRVYDFALPPLILHALFQADAGPLARWLAISPRNAVTVLDTHDGIGVIDVGADAATGGPGLLEPAQIDALVETMHERSKHQSQAATGAAASNLDLYQVNSTYYDALGRRPHEYLMARALQFFAPGIPQVYYVGLLAGENDMELLARTKTGRDINRHYYTPAAIEAAMQQPVVQELCRLIRFRNSQQAFDGTFSVAQQSASGLRLRWERDHDWVQLDVDLSGPSAVVSAADGFSMKISAL